MDTYLDNYLPLLQSISNVMLEQIDTNFPHLYKYIQTHKEKINIQNENDILELYNQLLSLEEQFIQIFNDSTENKEKIKQEKEKWISKEDKSLWTAFKQIIHPNSLLNNQIIFLQNQIQHSLLSLIYLSSSYQFTPKAKSELPKTTGQRLEPTFPENKKGLTNSFCMFLSSQIEAHSPNQQIIKKLDDRLNEKSYARVCKQLESLIPTIKKGSQEQLLHLLKLLKKRIENCVIAINQIPIDIHEIYFQYPPEIKGLEQAFIHIVTQKRCSIAKEIGNKATGPHNVHDLRAVIYKLNQLEGVEFPDYFLEKKAQEGTIPQQEICNSFQHLFTVPRLFIEEVMPLFWEFHRGITGQGKQFVLSLQHSLDPSQPSCFLDVNNEDFATGEGTYRFVNPLFLFNEFKEKSLIQKKRSKSHYIRSKRTLHSRQTNQSTTIRPHFFFK